MQTDLQADYSKAAYSYTLDLFHQLLTYSLVQCFRQINSIELLNEICLRRGYPFLLYKKWKKFNEIKNT